MFKIGDEIVITEQIHNQWKKLHFYDYLKANYPIGYKGRCYAKRLSRTDGHMCILWEDGKDTNTEFFKDTDLVFEEPKFKELSIMEAPKDVLSPAERVFRQMVEDGMVENKAYYILNKVVQVMNKLGLVFYEP